MTRVLHVVDRADGGVPLAVRTYIKNSPAGFEHHVLSPFARERPVAAWDGVPAMMHDLGAGTFHRVRAVRRTAARIQAHVVHSHSSFSGVYTRLALNRTRQAIIHTPHCYAFERADVGKGARHLYRVIENVLAWNTTAVAACSRGERDAALSMPGIADRALYVPNIATVDAIDSASHATALTRVGMAGRISSQKDPGYFIEWVSQARRIFPALEAVWIGDGDEVMKRELIRHDIEVTGWRTGDALVDELDRLNLYVHSAAWEGFPLALLDARARSLPMLARPISAFLDLPEELSTAGPNGLVREDGDPADFGQWSVSNRTRWAVYLSENTVARQREMLRRAWNSGTSRRTEMA